MKNQVNVNSQVTLGYGKANVNFNLKSIDVGMIYLFLVILGLGMLAKALK